MSVIRHAGMPELPSSAWHGMRWVRFKIVVVSRAGGTDWLWLGLGVFFFRISFLLRALHVLFSLRIPFSKPLLFDVPLVYVTLPDFSMRSLRMAPLALLYADARRSVLYDCRHER